MDLIYQLMDANYNAKEFRHAQIVMKELGITYKKAIPQSIADSWVFEGCENVPKELPTYLTKKIIRQNFSEISNNDNRQDFIFDSVKIYLNGEILKNKNDEQEINIKRRDTK